MVRQRSVRKSKVIVAMAIADSVHDAGAVQGPESEMADQDGDNGPRFYRSASRVEFNPADIELLPGRERGSRPLEVGRAASDRNHRFVEVAPPGLGGVATRGFFANQSDRAVRQRQLPRRFNEARDCVVGRSES